MTQLLQPAEGFSGFVTKCFWLPNSHHPCCCLKKESSPLEINTQPIFFWGGSPKGSGNSANCGFWASMLIPYFLPQGDEGAAIEIRKNATLPQTSKTETTSMSYNNAKGRVFSKEACSVSGEAKAGQMSCQ